MINYPKFGEPLEMHTDASGRKIGSVFAQDGKHLAFDRGLRSA